MEHFVCHHEGKLKIAPVDVLRASLSWVLLAGALTTSAGFASDSQASTGSNTLDFANGLYARKMYLPAIAEYEKFLKMNPNSPEAASARFRYADSYYFTKDYAAAIANFELFLSIFPQDKRTETASFRLGTARYYSGDAARAIRIFRKISKTSQDALLQSGSIFYLAKSLENKGKSDRSVRLLKQLSEKDTGSEYTSYAGVALGDLYLKEGNYPEALNGYKAAADSPNPTALARQARFKVAEIYFTQKNYEAAAPYYEKVFTVAFSEENTPAQTAEKESLKAKALLGLFYCDFNRQDLESAERRFSVQQPSIVSSGVKPEIELILANLLSAKGRHDDAIAKLNDILGDTQVDDPLKEKVLFKKISDLSAKGDKDASLKELESFFSGPSHDNERALFEKAELLLEIGRYPEALAAYQKVTSNFPGSDLSKSAQFQSAMTFLKMAQEDKARTAFRSFANKYPSDTRADLALLQIIQIDLDAKNFKQAFDGADTFIKTHPQSELLDIGYYKLGVAATALGRYSHAAFVFRKILENFHDSKLYTEALYGAGVALENDHKMAEALSFYEKLLKDAPNHPLTQEVWQRVSYLYIQNNDVEKVKSVYEELIFKKTDIPIDTDGIFWLIQQLLDRSDYGSLNRILDALPGRFPEKDIQHEVLFFKGEAAMGMKDYAKAMEFYSQTVQNKADGVYVPQAVLGMGIAHAALGDTTSAEKDFNEAVKYDHEAGVVVRARFELANLRLMADDLEGAAKAFMLVAILFDDPKYTPPALYKAGECFQALGRPEDSEKAFLELKNKYPESDWAGKINTRNVMNG